MTVSLVGRMAMGRSISLFPDLVTHATCAPSATLVGHPRDLRTERGLVTHATCASGARVRQGRRDRPGPSHAQRGLRDCCQAPPRAPAQCAACAADSTCMASCSGLGSS